MSLLLGLSSGPDLTLALTGVSTTGAVGNLTVSFDIALTGASSTAAVGTIAPTISIALNGVALTAAVGTVVADRSVALTGVFLTSAVGNVTPPFSLANSGVSSTGSAGTLEADRTIDLTGVESIASIGTVTYSSDAGGDITLALTGVETTAAVGTVIQSGADVIVPPVQSFSTGGGGGSGSNPAERKRKKREDEELTEDIRRLYRKLVLGEVPAIASRAEAIVAAITPEVRVPRIDVPRDAQRKAEVEARITALTIQKLTVEHEIALRMAEQELEAKRAQRAENMRRIQLILQVI